ncbi:NAD(P)-dependent oxidoreductase [Streptomyces sp. V4-01]|uniref:NAD(P)-dependent oxidoreductase n=1 Tax=Actinacidiphila polyblastidii TaxID=3110430 RepID=A0ABU7PB51_9ACTN|nr:NAD(P)-dependent oxidoreductase [Streptomyces sp. V4-01]
MNEQLTVLVTGTAAVPHDARRLIADRGFALREIADDHVSAEDLHGALDGVAGYLIGGYEEPEAAHFERAAALEAVAFVGTDFQSYVPGWRRAHDLGIALANTPGENAASVAEFTLLLALTLARPFTASLLHARDAAADPVVAVPPPEGRELGGRTLGVIGAGRIGARVARCAQALGMRVLYTSPRRNRALEAATGIAYTDLRGILSQSDVITLHRPGPTPDEPATLGREELAICKDGALLVNTGHHGLVDPLALAWAIEHRNLRAAFDGLGPGDAWAALTAFGPERFLAVPQMGFLTRDAGLRAGLRAASAVCDVLSGASSPDVTNPGFRERREAVRRGGE